jgi:hypothetical protein
MARELLTNGTCLYSKSYVFHAKSVGRTQSEVVAWELQRAQALEYQEVACILELGMVSAN